MKLYAKHLVPLRAAKISLMDIFGVASSNYIIYHFITDSSVNEITE